jgi:hypothetical protein
MQRRDKLLRKSGCRFSPIEKAGNTYKFTARCSLTMPAGTISAETTSVLTVESADAYTVDVSGTTNGKRTRERLAARRMGDCRP